MGIRRKGIVTLITCNVKGGKCVGQCEMSKYGF